MPNDTEDCVWMTSIHIAARSDGGLRVWSDDMPGLVLSGSNPDKVMASILPAISAIRAHQQTREAPTTRSDNI